MRTLLFLIDVLQADGGTRTASVTGAFVALADAVDWAVKQGIMKPRAGKPILTDTLSAVSAGIVDGHAVLDLPYEEDSRADTDMNVVATGAGKFIEIQGTAEHEPFSREELNAILDLAGAGTAHLAQLQREVLFGENAIDARIIGGAGA